MLGLFFTREQTGHYATAHADDGGTAAVGVHHAVDALHGLLTLVLDPLGDGLAQPWGIDKAMLGAQGVHGAEDGLSVTVFPVLKGGHRGKSRVGHLGYDDSRRKTVLDVLTLEALAKGSVCSEDGPVVAHIDHSALGLVGVVVLTPFIVVEGQTVDVILT